MSETTFMVIVLVMAMLLIEKMAVFLLIPLIKFKITFKQFFHYKVISAVEILVVLYVTAYHLSAFAGLEMFPYALFLAFFLAVLTLVNAYILRYKMLDWERAYLIELTAIDGSVAEGVFWHDGVKFCAWMQKTAETKVGKRYEVYVVAIAPLMPRTVRVEQKA